MKRPSAPALVLILGIAAVPIAALTAPVGAVASASATSSVLSRPHFSADTRPLAAWAVGGTAGFSAAGVALVLARRRITGAASIT